MLKVVPYALYPSLEAAIADGWPTAEYGLWASGPNDVHKKWCWCAMTNN
mgnify:FL=1